MQKVSILGYGKSGRAAAHLAGKLGHSVSVFDERLSPDVLPAVKHPLMESELVVISPGISGNSELMHDAISSGAQIISELEFGFLNCTRPILAITGTNGKTTTTELTAHLLNNMGMKTEVAGNIGVPLSETVASGKFYECLVVEVSSFQLEMCNTFAPHGAALLNITSDHMDRYSTFDDYIETKFKIFKNMPEGSNMVVNENLLPHWNKYMSEDFSPHIFSSHSQLADFFYKDGIIYFEGARGIRPVIALNETHLVGVHNAENLMAAMALICSFCPTEALFSDNLKQAIMSFIPGRHRLELVADVEGVKYINDSKATNPDSVVVALKAYGGEANVCIILGGLDKEMDFTILRGVAGKIKKAFIIGEAKDRIEHALSDVVDCQVLDAFEEAVLAACQAAASGDIVMLSPACASMDMFKDYAERGDRFGEMVKLYLSGQGK